MKTAILTDTDSSLPLDLAQRHQIYQVPIVIQFGAEAFDAVYDIDDARTFERIDRTSRLPTTAAPSPGKFVEAYQAAFAQGAERVICICVSSQVSATYAAAVAGRDQMPERDITVIDSQSLSMAQGFMVLAAAQAAEDGAPVEQIVEQVRQVGQRTRLYAALSTLKYLAMSGRVGHLAAGLAGLLNVRPILTIRNGKLELLERVRTRSKAWDRMVELIKSDLNGQRMTRMAILHVNAAADARQFEALLRGALDCPAEVIHTGLTPGLSVHSGAGLVGVVYLTGE